MKMLFVRLAFAGILVIGGSGASATRLDLLVGTKAAQPFVAVSYAGKSRTTQVVDADYQLSDQERALLAFSRLKADAERGAR